MCNVHSFVAHQRMRETFSVQFFLHKKKESYDMPLICMVKG